MVCQVYFRQFWNTHTTKTSKLSLHSLLVPHHHIFVWGGIETSLE